MLKEALYKEYPFLGVIPSIIKARRITVDYFNLKFYDLSRVVGDNEEWYVVTISDRVENDCPPVLEWKDMMVIPIPAWEGDCLGSCVIDEIQRPLEVVRYLVCVEDYTTPNVCVNIYAVKDMMQLIDDAIDSEMQELRLKREAITDWITSVGEIKPEVCDD